MDDTRRIQTPIQFRDLSFDRAAVDGEGRTIDLSFSSESPVVRWIDGERANEVLSHTKRHVRLDRLRDDGPLLLDHWPDEHVGVLRNVRIDPDSKRGMAGAYVSLAGKGPEVLTMAAEGVKTKTSVGYRVHRFRREDPMEDGGLPTYRAIDWEPLEVSLVSMPADTSVGVGRNEASAQYARSLGIPEHTNTTIEGIRDMNDATDNTRTDPPAPPPAAPPQLTPPVSKPEIDINAERERVRNEELARVREIAALGKQHKADELASRHVQEGRTLDEFRSALLEELSRRPESGVTPVRRLTDVGLSETEKREWSIARAILACADKDWARAGLEREVSLAVGQQLGREAQGFFIPPDVPGWSGQRDLTIGSAVAGGNLKGTDHRGDLYVDALRERTIVAQLGAQFLTDLVGDVTIPAANAVTTTYWVAENSAPTEGAPTYRQITMAPKTIAAYVDMSRRTLLQTSPGVENLVRNDLVTGVAIAVDKVAINGGGTNEPSGVLSTTGIGSVDLGTNGGAPTWAGVVNVMKEVDIDNALMGALAFATTPHARAKMMQTGRQASGVEGNFIIPAERPAELIGYRIEVSNAVPSTLADGSGSNLSALVFGNWNDLIIGQWSGVDVLVDPYSLSTAGALRVTVFQDVDTAVRHVQSFSAIQDMITT